ncbi:MAG: YdcF family protein [Candidatus Paceibacterota bacterium]|jgi:uncharacterized SAM-binding protein YcdF (DUF218 family)
MTNEEITKYVFIDDENPTANIALVFGTWNAQKSAVEKAVEIFKRGLVPKIIFSGGLNENSGMVESESMANEAIKSGIASEDIYIENRSTNTLENVLFSLALIDKELGLENVNAITAIMKNYHSRRVLMTLKKHVPNHIILKAAPYKSPQYDFDRNNWMESELGKEKVSEEVSKIEKYLIKGDLAEL